ncbi:WxL domain-containing protein [Apilactobacillus quenuiae]|uniref:WxL domain-containing protein n=1 Tax=Apilactobacillus quenuiae TaxID=2008377 RepID=UPI000D011B28|nr:WxL domain-containing protein [Apilactobacillus quenuiae]
MKNSNFIKSTLILGLTFGLCAAHLTLLNAHADDVTTSSQQTKATLTFRQPDKTNVTPPVDPNNPSQPAKTPADPGDPNNTGTNSGGPLSIDYAPNFDFGVGTISGQTKVYTLANATYADGKTRNHNPFVQISDNRGTASGWNLNASISDFTNTAGNTNQTLKGAQVSIKSEGNTPQVGFNGTGIAPSLNSSSIALGNASQNLMTANQGQGTGTWIEKFDPNQVTLSVPGGSAQSATQYNANITWNLTASPLNPTQTTSSQS